MCWESSDVVRFDIGPLLGPTRIAKVKGAYNSLISGYSSRINGLRVLGCETN